MSCEIYRGQIYYANLDPIIGSEQSGFRPVLILQNDIGNLYSDTVLVAPITSRVATKNKLPTHVKIHAFDKLQKDSIILTEHIRSIDKQRLEIYLGKLNEIEMKKVDTAIEVAFGLRRFFNEK